METGGPIVGGFLLQAAMRLRRSRALELLDDLVTAPRASPEEVREAQFRRLSDLLAHAEARVPAIFNRNAASRAISNAPRISGTPFASFSQPANARVRGPSPLDLRSL